MNTNSKHYELLAIEPWDIMEANFPPEAFIAYLKGNIIKYTLRDKGQALTDAQKIKHYAEKLIEVLEAKENDKDNWTITGVKPEEVEDKYLIAEGSKFKVGDRVKLKYLEGQNGTIIRQPVLGLRSVDEENYIVELDKDEEGEQGWKATKKEHLVDCERAWYVDDTEIELLQDAEDKHKFKVGDRVEVLNWKRHLGDDNKATVIRQNDKSYPTKKGYLVELDKELAGWKATEEKNGVDCKNTWWVYEDELKLLETEPKKTLETNKWYDAEDFTVEELKELLPVGTKVFVIENYESNYDNEIDLAKKEWLRTTVTNIDKGFQKKTRVGITRDIHFRRYFKIVEED